MTGTDDAGNTQPGDDGAELRFAEERIRIATEAGGFATWQWDLGTDRVVWNDLHFDLLGMQRRGGPVRPDDFLDHLHRDDRERIVRELDAAIAGRTPFAADFRIVKDGGETRWMQGYGSVVEERDGEPATMSGVMRDITDEKRVGDALQEAEGEAAEAHVAAEEAARARDRFFAALSHELRTPLTPMLLASRVLDREPALSPRARHAVAVLQRSIRQQAKLIEGLLDVGRLSREPPDVQRVPVAFARVLERTIDAARAAIAGASHDLTTDLRAVARGLHGDEERLGQVFAELLHNACHSTPAGGQVVVRSYDDGPRVVVEVEDSGDGFAAEDAEHVFEVFERTEAARDDPGDVDIPGLGLARARASVEAHGGRMAARSAGPGRGATFTVELPLRSGAG